MPKPIVIASANGDVGIGAAIEILRAGGSALDAVEAAARLVELNVDDHSVGVGGYPNLLGEVELDASIMDGASRRAGAVAALTGYPNPISVARAVMEQLPHVLLVGDGAARFAAETGFEPMELLTEHARAAWENKVVDRSAGSFASLVQDPEKTVGTVNFIAIDEHGDIASAVSTSGWAFKYPGRVGDSPIIGAGNYCDNRYGACCCTGLGEWAIRASTARTVVHALRAGLPLPDACAAAMADLRDIPLPNGLEPIMNLIALDADGNHIGYSTAGDRSYVWQTLDMAEHEVRERIEVVV